MTDSNLITYEPSSLEVFTLPCTTKDKEQRLLDQLRKKITQRYNTGLVIGRFQPLHYGHIFLLKQSLQVADTVVIGIGSSNVLDIDNPFSVEQREHMVQKALEREKEIQARIKRIVHIKDVPDDNMWLEETLKLVPEADVIIGNNSWVNGIFEQAKYPIFKTPLYNRNLYEGKKSGKNFEKELIFIRAFFLKHFFYLRKNKRSDQTSCDSSNFSTGIFLNLLCFTSNIFSHRLNT